MRNRILAIALFFIGNSITLHAQTNFDTQKKFYFFKVWGFLKYQHPALASGAVDADSLLLAKLPVIDQSKSPAVFNSMVKQLLLQLNALQQLKLAPKDTGTLRTQNVDWSWYAKDKFLSRENGKLLQYIHQHRYITAKPYYYTPQQYDGELPHEKVYPFADTVNIPYAYRMLSLAKLQAMVDYLFPHKAIMDVKWDVSVKKAIPLFSIAASRLEYETALLKLVATMNDSHGLDFQKQMKTRKGILHIKYYMPFDYTLINSATQILVTKLIIPEICAAADIKAGDIITKMNDQTVTDRIDFLAQYLSAGNRSRLAERVGRWYQNLLFVTDSLHSNLTYLSGNQIKNTSLELVGNQRSDLFPRVTDYIRPQLAPKYHDEKLDFIKPGIAYFKADETQRLYQSLPQDKFYEGIDSILTVAASGKGMIFDLRTYPDWGGLVNMFYNKFGQNTEFFHHYYQVNKQDMGTFILMTALADNYPPTVKPGHQRYKGKVVIIVNGETRSLGESNDMYFKKLFPGSLTIGEQTSGANGDVKMLNLPGGYQFEFTGNGIFYPDETPTQKIGIKIDEVVHPKVDDILQDKDTLLLRAIEIIEGKW